MRRSTLRTGVFVAGILLIAAGAVVALACAGFLALELAGFGLILIIALAIERWRYKSVTGCPPEPGWVATGERFVDPETGKVVTVFFRPASGERRYVALPEDAGSPVSPPS